MNQGVEILLERMQLHPEEFAMNNMKWRWVRHLVDSQVGAAMRTGGPYLNNEEIKLIQDAYIKIDGDEFTRRVAEEIMRDPHENVPQISSLTAKITAQTTLKQLMLEREWYAMVAGKL